MSSEIPHDVRRLLNPVHVPRMFTVEGVVSEAPEVKTFFFKEKIEAKPGQFVMLWLPGVGEKPFGLSYIGRGSAVTIACVGAFTKAACKLKTGDRVGVRGPYGSHYTVSGGKAVLVGGGFGAAPLAALADELAPACESVRVVLGARTESKLFFVERFRAAGAEVFITTDDGSSGVRGFASDEFERITKKEKPDVVYSCGPEPMMRKVMDFALKEKIECQLSLERYMKCGMGLCGSCSLGRFMVCRDGPVFNAEDLVGTEFGKFSRDASGKPKSVGL